MLGIHRTNTILFARRAARPETNNLPSHRRRRRAWKVECLEGRTLPSNFSVTNLNDDGGGSLRQAIVDSNKDSSAGTNEIDFAAGLSGMITLTSGELLIANHDVSIVGPGANTVTVSGNNADAVLAVAGYVNAKLTGLRISSGKTSSEGGGIYNDGNLAVSNSVIAGCSAYRGGGILNNGTLTLTECSISDNSSIGYNGGGGGIYNRGTLTVTNCTVANNSTDWYGGGIVGVAGGTMTITGTDVVHNSGVMGAGGIFNDCKTPNTLTNSTVAYNSGGGTGGGGIGLYGGWMTIVYSTIAYNKVDSDSGSGGGLYSERDGPLYTLYNTIVALNTRFTSTGLAPSDIAAIVSSSSAHNLVGTGGSSGLMNGSDGNLVGVADPGLAPKLDDNGGPTQTITLVPGSPAIDSGDSTNAPPTDQRGFARVGPPDIGAFEYQGQGVDTTDPTTTVSLAGTFNGSGWYLGPVTVTLSAADPDNAPGTLITTYSLDGGPTATYDSAHPLVITTDGVHSLTYQSRDPAGNVEAAQTQTFDVLDRIPVTAVMACSAPSSAYGQTVTINVQIVPPSGAGTPTGTVIFMDSSGNRVLGESKLSGSIATFSVSSLEVGSHAIRAIYLGDGQFDHLVSDSATQSVSPASTSMAFVVKAAASHRGFILHAKVNPVSPGGGMPTGSVAFAVGGTCFRKVRVVNGQAQLFVTNRNALGRSFHASYRCDSRCYKPTVSKAVFASRRLAQSVPSAPRAAQAGVQTTRAMATHPSANVLIRPPGDRSLRPSVIVPKQVRK